MLRGTHKQPLSEINVVPYIDVMLVLLVIFMITAPLLTQGVKVDLPQSQANPIDQDQREPLVVTVDKQGALFLNVGENLDSAITRDVLVQRVAAVLRHKPQTSVLIRGDVNANYGHVVDAMTLLQQAGVPSVGLITETPSSIKKVK